MLFASATATNILSWCTSMGNHSCLVFGPRPQSVQSTGDDERVHTHETGID
jgi:hypothetical protein